jgi:acyl-CoA synthetase (AMP-forming)/AMP-acid ligase II
MGHRIELGEIEAKANACPLIRKCCCVYNEFNKQLVLFCETANGEATVKDIKNYLKENLSDYMVPNKIKLLESLPLNPNGKIDRKGLKESIM